MSRRLALALALATGALLSACAATARFDAYEGDTTPRLGQGGAKTVVDGMEIWTRGEPPRRYRIVGYLEMDQSPYTDTNKTAVARARQAGGDALVRGEVVQVSESVFQVRYTVIQTVN